MTTTQATAKPARENALENSREHVTVKHLTPAQTVISLFGGVRQLARLLDLNPSSVCRWARPTPPRRPASVRRYSAASGVSPVTVGCVPSALHRPLLDLAKREGVTLTADDLVFGRDVEK
jgi:hypothetical protein